WATAATNVQTAIDATIPADEVWVESGVYTPAGTDRTQSFILKSDVGIYGGFNGTESEREARDPNPASNGSVLSGDLNGDDGANFANSGENSYHVLIGTGVDSNAVLDGFTVRGGTANGSTPHDRGGGLLCDGSGSPTIRNCHFLSHRAIDGGAAFYDSAHPLFKNCLFADNQANRAAGIYNASASHATFVNCVFQGNRASLNQGGGLFIGNNAFPQLINCTFSDNFAQFAGAGIHVNASAQPALFNCIIWSNQSAFGPLVPQTSINPINATVSYDHCLIQNYNLTGEGSGNFDGTDPGNTPLFLSPTDLRLLAGSPGIDVGNNAANTCTNDLSHNPRVVDAIIDLGAYEFTILSAYDLWAASNGLNGADADACADPNNDGYINLWHFAHDLDPNGDGSKDGKFRIRVLSQGTNTWFTYTFPVRTGAVFGGAPAQTATADSAVYSIDAGLNLQTFDQAVMEVVPAESGGMPGLSGGWEYRTFRLTSDAADIPKGFIGVRVDKSP
ncbi:MAG: right-handed parallel beta-helix repeat-containing protein, partial [Verrucomicrobiota bacterium]